MEERLKKYVDPWVKLYSVIPLIVVFAWNSLIYFGTSQVTKSWHHYDLTTSLDRAVPFVPEFVYIYLGCYLFWIVNYVLIGHLGKEHFYRFVAAEMPTRLVCGLFFLLFPTTNVRPEISVTSVSTWLMNMVYQVDLPSNLFPSIHCMVSWFCFIGIRGQEKIPRWYRAFSCIFALLVCASTQFTKQHYLIDVAGGIFLAEFSYYLSNHGNYYIKFKEVFEKCNCKMKHLLLKS
ncbi:MAG: phosphatase PAP2 family protein [Lachnospiraceae bacterium]|nr:phosphatase PAP2 family protein [Robinsoniella sp.]MDY3765158.1 phosphatase PAP2 family protein [Lachnospiraceae bacterium]